MAEEPQGAGAADRVRVSSDVAMLEPALIAAMEHEFGPVRLELEQTLVVDPQSFPQPSIDMPLPFVTAFHRLLTARSLPVRDLPLRLSSTFYCLSTAFP